MLTMTTLINSVNAALPKISYMKSIDIYLFACFFMVFAALIEYASKFESVSNKNIVEDISLTDKLNEIEAILDKYI